MRPPPLLSEGSGERLQVAPREDRYRFVRKLHDGRPGATAVCRVSGPTVRPKIAPSAAGRFTVLGMANELEFQGDVLTWMAADITARRGLRIGGVGQEKQYADSKRSDLVIWRVRDIEALAAVELKTIATPLSNVTFQDDVIKKGRRVGAPYCVLWNQRESAIYITPAAEEGSAIRKEVFLGSPLASLPLLDVVTTKDYVGKPALEAALRGRARDILTAISTLSATGAVGGRIVDPSVFVEWLGREVRDIRRDITDNVRKEAAKDRSLRTTLGAWATAQGMSAPRIEVLYERASAQLAYRIVGQAVFYLAYQGHMKDVAPFTILKGLPLIQQLQSLWTGIRAIDYEALFAPDSVLDALPLSALAETALRALLTQLAEYDWAKLDTAVLGAVFENLIPVAERDLLGQYFTSAELADLIIAFCVDGATKTVLDPACGTGEFLVRSYDRMKRTGAAITHGARLDAIWGVDISHFPTELAVINLSRQDFTQPNNFPRVVVSDFFDFNTGDVHLFPPARVGVGQGKVPIRCRHSTRLSEIRHTFGGEAR